MREVRLSLSMLQKGYKENTGMADQSYQFTSIILRN